MGDFLRLRTYFNLQPRGAMELSYLHILCLANTLTAKLATLRVVFQASYDSTSMVWTLC